MWVYVGLTVEKEVCVRKETIIEHLKAKSDRLCYYYSYVRNMVTETQI